MTRDMNIQYRAGNQSGPSKTKSRPLNKVRCLEQQNNACNARKQSLQGGISTATKGVGRGVATPSQIRKRVLKVIWILFAIWMVIFTVMMAAMK